MSTPSRLLLTSWVLSGLVSQAYAQDTVALVDLNGGPATVEYVVNGGFEEILVEWMVGGGNPTPPSAFGDGPATPPRTGGRSLDLGPAGASVENGGFAEQTVTLPVGQFVLEFYYRGEEGPPAPSDFTLSLTGAATLMEDFVTVLGNDYTQVRRTIDVSTGGTLTIRWTDGVTGGNSEADPLIDDVSLLGATLDTNAAGVFTEGGGPIGVAGPTAEVHTFAEDDIVSLQLLLDGFVDGASERIGIAGQTISLNEDVTIQDISIGTTAVDISYDHVGGAIEVFRSDGGLLPMPQSELTMLVRAITYENLSMNPATTDRTIEFTAIDADALASNTAISTISVVAVNSPPTAVGDTASTAEGVQAIVDVLGNDADPEDDVTTITQVNGMPIAVDMPVTIANAEIALNVDGTLLVTPAAGFVGAIGFSYTMSDGLLDATASVELTVLECISDAHCSGTMPVCDTGDSDTCVECIANSDCADGMICEASNQCTASTMPDGGVGVGGTDGGASGLTGGSGCALAHGRASNIAACAWWLFFVWMTGMRRHRR